MENTELVLLRETAIQLIRECNDEDMLDLLCKLLLECAAEEM